MAVVDLVVGQVVDQVVDLVVLQATPADLAPTALPLLHLLLRRQHHLLLSATTKGVETQSNLIV